ncbi:AfsR/SARP family transcriptional regulator [Actinomadura macrotermitis]|uniref:Regulatory protein AfsR n=1 Tax=Actinomadura macrotermitis TaxID=2585200 RepID=A0A7K0C4S7_9ACTN|nr:BTAD domain-containing putative transcriptional regulator [Actinomadura macrotermitis]MQY08408.1 Regulatory protein AfsR [Actinomadura macrotermitis]
MMFHVLGPVEIRHEGRSLRPAGSHQRTVLALLLLNADRPVPLARVIEAVWGDRAPRTATAKVHNLVCGLRKLIAGCLGPAEATRIIATRAPGYLAQPGPGRLDLAEFEHRWCLARAHERAGRPEPARAELATALDLWRGTALGDVAAPLADAMGPVLEERRLTALEERIALDLRLGRHADLVSELSALLAAHPFREGLRGQMMTALRQAGRPAEALAVYRQGRRLMTEELGLEPGAELRRLHESILAGRADDRPAARTRPAAPVRPVPTQLPRDDAGFTGRRAAVAALAAALAGPGRMAPVAVVSGMPGIGKTTLAVHAAHRLRDRFPDGQLYLELRGSSARPVPPGDALRRLIRALGAAPPPTGSSDELAALYRTALAGRRMLIVLDDAAAEGQVRPLLPGGPGCAVLVTSRRALAALDADTRLPLEVFSRAESLEFLARAAGGAAIRREAGAARLLAGLCGDLPLALRIVAAKLTAHPQHGPGELARRLAAAPLLLDELCIGDLDVRTRLDAHLRRSPRDQRASLRVLARAGRRPFSLPSAAVALATDPADAARRLEALGEAHLVSFGSDARYRIHPLVRALTGQDAARDGRL